jgi:hypothetical protein
MVTQSQADQLVEAGLADCMRHSLRLKLGIRWIPPRLDLNYAHDQRVERQFHSADAGCG